MFALLALLNILSTGLLVGAMMEVAIADVPLFLKLPRETFIIVHQGIDRHKHPYMPAYTIITVITALGEVLFYRNFWQVFCLAVGLTSIMSVGIISELINVPLNRKIYAWSSSSTEEDVLVMRDKWIQAHYLRTAAGVLGLIALLLPFLTILNR
jgi:hypothetical protein